MEGHVRGRRGGRAYRRVYKACIACRERKIKCDLGENAAPHPPPCARCRREQRECTFDDATPKPKRPRSSAAAFPSVSSSTNSPDTPMNGTDTSPRPLADAIMYPTLAEGRDAMSILFEAAIQDDNLAGRHRTDFNSILMTSPGDTAEPRPAVLSNENLNLWNSCRFVRMGWFTAYEAIILVEAFFRRMCPLTPVLTTYYADPAHHRQLLSQDPFLCSVILMIASRYHMLPGPCGISRSFGTHNRLWNYCENLLLKILLRTNQEQDCSLFTPGTVEGLLLLTEWQPRALHQPPDGEGWDANLLIETTPHVDFSKIDHKNVDTRRWQRHISEPSQRAIHSSWMLFSCAMSLAHAIGIFDSERARKTDGKNAQHDARITHLRTILTVFGFQISSRAGCATGIDAIDLTEFSKDGSMDEAATSSSGQTEAWVELNELYRTITSILYSSPDIAQALVSSGRYRGCVNHFNSVLDRWREKYSNLQEMRYRFSDLLMMEYHYIRAYTNALGLRALQERLTVNERNMSSSSVLQGSSTTSLNDIYVEQAITEACAILRKVAELSDRDDLKFCPFRVFSYIITAAILLIAAIRLGQPAARESAILELMDRAILGLKSCPVDDVHLSSKIGIVLEIHVKRIRQSQVANASMGAAGQSADATTLPEPLQSESGLNSRMQEDWIPMTSSSYFSLFQELSEEIGGFEGLSSFEGLCGIPAQTGMTGFDNYNRM